MDTREFQIYKVDELAMEVKDLQKGIYGEGKDPGLMTRTALIENAILDMKDTFSKLSKWVIACFGAIAFLIFETAIKFLFHVP
jgi:hypothetical protein